MSDQPKLAVEQVFDLFQKFAKELFGVVAEPRSVVLVVDWQIGQTDFPAGILVTRDKSMAPGDLLDIASQLNKMGLRITNAYAKAIEEAKELNAQLERTLLDKQQQLDILTKQLNNKAASEAST